MYVQLLLKFICGADIFFGRHIMFYHKSPLQVQLQHVREQGHGGVSCFAISIRVWFICAKIKAKLAKPEHRLVQTVLTIKYKTECVEFH